MARSGSKHRIPEARMWTGDRRGAPRSAAAPATDRPRGPEARPDGERVHRSAERRRLLLASLGIGLAVTMVGATVVGPSPADEAPAENLPADVAVRLSPTPSDGTTTTAQTARSVTVAAPEPIAPGAPRATTTTTTVATTTTAPPPVPVPTPAAAAPTARATADPALPRYIDQVLPLGVTARISGCAWQTTDGGRLIAVGTVTNAPATNRSWTLTMHFLQARRELARASTVVPLGAGQSQAWTIISALPVPPPDLLCSLSAA
jgi:hypothetical protein